MISQKNTQIEKGLEAESLISAPLTEALRPRETASNILWDTPLSNPDHQNNLYALYSSSLTTNTDLIFYESMSGARIMDSPYSIFKYISEQSDFSTSTVHIWSCGTDDIIPEGMRGLKNVFFVKRHTPRYMYLLASSKHIIGNSVLPTYFVRKPNQKYLNTWHGIGYKRLGRSDNNPLGSSKSVTNMFQSTHLISPCRFMTNIMLDGFSLRNSYTAELAETGYPRIDETINLTSSQAKSLQSVLSIDTSKPTVLYAPTWRGETNSENKQLQQLDADLKMLAKFDANIVFLGHHIMSRRIRERSYSGIIIPDSNINTNELLAVSDVLITDYSSIFFDFLVTRRPIIHYLYDYRTYESTRGLSLELGELPGEVAFDSVSLQLLTSAALCSQLPISKRYHDAINRFCPYEDGYASKRVSNWFFTNKSGIFPQAWKDTRPRVAFWGGSMVDSEFLMPYLSDLRKRNQAGTEQITLVVSSQAKKNSQVISTIRELGNTISVVTRYNHEMGMTPLERAARKIPNQSRTPKESDLYDNMYKREYLRLFGATKFDEVVMYREISHFWKKLGTYARKG